MRAILLCSMLAFGAAPTVSLGDVLPPPTRPDWNDPPAPLPDPPEARLRCIALAVSVAAFAGMLVARRRTGSREVAA